MISLRDVAVSRGSTRVVEDLTVEIKPGAIFWVVGANGAGKSSLLRVMIGLDRPRQGTVHHRIPPPGRVLYFQSEMAVPPTATVGAWHRLVNRLGGTASGERTPLWPTAAPGRRVGRLSTGERKRLLLDALLRQPGALVLDEPFEHLSPDAKTVLAQRAEERAREEVVVIATNQATERAIRIGGLRLEGGTATFLIPRGSGA